MTKWSAEKDKALRKCIWYILLGFSYPPLKYISKSEKKNEDNDDDDEEEENFSPANS